MPQFCFEPLGFDHRNGMKDAWKIVAFSAGDARGRLTKSFEAQIYRENGIAFHVDETFASVSGKNVVRGLHFQRRHPQAKLVSVVAGRVFDVIVDLRPQSETFARWVSAELSAENHRALYVPQGFAHGFAALEDGSVMLYQCEGAYDRQTDTGIRFDDPHIGIRWPLRREEMICSQRDLGLMSLEEYCKNPMQMPV